MKHILFTKELLLSAVALFAIIATSCIREDLDQCYTLKLKVENIKGDDITEYGWMESTDLYIFDENLNYLEKRSLDKNFIRSRNEIVLDGYTADRSLRIVAWGNVNALGEKQSVSEAMAESSGKDDFIARLKERNIDLILRHTDTGRIYGATFIDHNTRTVLNGSRLGRQFSANALEQWLTAGERPSVVPVQPDTRQEQPQPDTQPSQSDSQQPDSGNAQSNTAGQQTTGGTSQGQQHGQGQSQQQFRQGNSSLYEDMPSIPGLDLFHTGPGFDAEEEAFYRAMQRRKKKKRRGPKL